MTELPKNWVRPPLYDVVTINPKHRSNVGDDFPVSFVPMAAVSDIHGEIETPQVRPYGEIKRGYTHFQSGDVIFAKITPCMENGKIAVARRLTNGLACGTTEFHVLRPSSCIDAAFLWRYLRQKSFREDAERSMTGAVGQRRVPADYLKQTLIPLPSLVEQRRIVTKVGSLSGKSKRARDHLDHISRLVEKYKQAVLAAVFKGALRREAQRRDTLLTSLSQYCLSITDGDHQAPPQAEQGVPFVTISAMSRGRIDFGKVTRFVPRKYAESLKVTRRPQLNDVLYSVVGATYGVPALVREDMPFVFQRHIALLRPDPRKCDPLWLSYIMAAPQVYEQATVVATGTAQPTVPLGGLRSFRLPQLELDCQRRVSATLSFMFEIIDRLAHEATSARKLVDHLDQAVLAKAFRGELVPQDPNDEPASVLLERIRTERATSISTKSKRRGEHAKSRMGRSVL